MKVYVIFDPLYDIVVCVHEEPNMTCEKCKYNGINDGYGISESEFELIKSKANLRNEKINKLGI